MVRIPGVGGTCEEKKVYRRERKLIKKIMCLGSQNVDRRDNRRDNILISLIAMRNAQRGGDEWQMEIGGKRKTGPKEGPKTLASQCDFSRE